MQNFLQDGEILTLVAPYARDSGEGAKVGGFFGVAVSDVDSGDEGQFQTCGVFELDKTSAQAWSQGDRIYWNDSTKLCDTDSTVGMYIGTATADAANPSSTGSVKLHPGAEHPEGAQAAIADVSTADASDDTTCQALANALKTKLNVLLAELRLNGVLKP